MILLSSAIESKVAKATSTYPAVIIKVGERNNLFVDLQVYCPTTMSGLPSDAISATNNWLQAPLKPHNGDNVEEYNFQPGGVIIISYSDGNVNSPQFVRYLDVADDIIQLNYNYILGDPIIPDIGGAVLSITDDNLTLSSSILQKTVALLKYVYICARGTTSTTPNYDKEDPNENNILYLDSPNSSYRRCGKYGIELVSNSTSIGIGNYLKNTTFNKLYNSTYGTSNFLKISQYLLQKTGHKIIDTLKDVKHNFKAFDLYGDNGYYNDTSALYLWSMLAGYDEFKIGGKSINSKVYSEYSENDLNNLLNKESPLKAYLMTDMFYDRNKHLGNPSNKEFCAYFWYRFDSDFNNELDRIYAIDLNNNLYKLKLLLSRNTLESKLLICCAIIMTTYKSTEEFIYNSTVRNSDDNKDIKSFVDSLQKAVDIVTNAVSVYELNTKNYVSAEYIALNFSKIVYNKVIKYNLNDDNLKQTPMYKNIVKMIKEVIANWDMISSRFKEVIVVSPNSPSTTTPVSNNKFIWPVPGYPNISSPFGYRSNVYDSSGKLVSSGFHNGIDISGSGILGKPIIASAAGKVTISKFSNSAGYYVAINHGDGYVTRYLHAKSMPLVKVGDNVSQGQIIAYVGSTGNSTGPHLHFDINYQGNYVDPQNYVKYN